MIPFGKQLRDWRNKSGFSIEYVAHKLGCTVATVYRWERGAVVPKIGRINFINRILGTKFTRGVK